MTGIYIHIPFCKQKCHYCNFYSVATNKYRSEFVHALIEEITFRRTYLGDENIDTVYFGGGTPSLLTSDQLDQIFNALYNNYTISEDAEITLEANPDDLNKENIKQLVSSPVNRLSIGIQSFRDEDLKYLHRIHTATQSIDVIRKVQDAGFNELTLDLIFGIPTLSDKDWKANLDRFLSLKVPHLSAYALTLEPKTAMDVLIRKGKMKGLDEKKMADHFNLLTQLLTSHSYEHYEISNFCTEGHYAKHNTNYWLGGKYLGLGPSAHSYDGHSRQWNIGHLKAYIDGYENKTPDIEKEILTKNQAYNEYIMVSLRTMWGVNGQYLSEKFGKEYKAYFFQEIEKFIGRNQIEILEDYAKLTSQGKLFADGISADLFWPAENL